MDERYSEIMASLLDIKSTMKDISHMSVFCTDIETTSTVEPRGTRVVVPGPGTYPGTQPGTRGLPGNPVGIPSPFMLKRSSELFDQSLD